MERRKSFVGIKPFKVPFLVCHKPRLGQHERPANSRKKVLQSHHTFWLKSLQWNMAVAPSFYWKYFFSTRIEMVIRVNGNYSPQLFIIAVHWCSQCLIFSDLFYYICKSILNHISFSFYFTIIHNFVLLHHIKSPTIHLSCRCNIIIRESSRDVNTFCKAA